MTALGVGNLSFNDGIMDHLKYIELLMENLRPRAEKLGLGGKFKYHQDNDSKHSAMNTKHWLLYNCPKVIKTPPEFPNLNPFEHLWGYLEKKIERDYENPA